jgi:Domain of unknown function (DUF6378)
LAYGSPAQNFKRIVNALNALFEDKIRERLSLGLPAFDIEDWPRFLIVAKLSRSIETYRRDNPTDVAGYARTWEMVKEPWGWLALDEPVLSLALPTEDPWLLRIGAVNGSVGLAGSADGRSPVGGIDATGFCGASVRTSEIVFHDRQTIHHW